jgi:ferredoxin-NADP reductase/Na+-translocating ferredoxin:NAD+ oxidoreductase RnfD subunit
MKLIDGFLNKITMYRLVLYYLIALLVIAAILGYFHIMAYSPLAIGESVFILLVVSLLTNRIFVKVFNAHENVESAYISALILALIIPPLQSSNLSSLWFLIAAAVLAMASKFILAIGKKHIFNPVAISVVITAFALNMSANWWVGTLWMLPFVIIGGFLMVRKIQRSDLVVFFFVAVLATIMLFCYIQNTDVVSFMRQTLVDTPIFFFAFIMLTEPLTTPPTIALQSWYGAIVGILFAPQLHIGNVYSTPELALVIGNVFSYAVSPKEKLMLTLKDRIALATGTYEFVFSADKSIKFKPGQYLEWTLGHDKTDSRGNRRYFTIASAPSEKVLRMAVRFYQPPSTFKKELLEMKAGDTIVAAQLAGDFTMPKNSKQKLAFIAGGIGITPFRSMIGDLLVRSEQRDIVLFYANRNASEIAYGNIFEWAKEDLGIKTVFTLTGSNEETVGWQGYRGYISEEMIRREMPDYKARMFYISGPNTMVDAYEKLLLGMGIREPHIIIDYFPGF